MSETNTTRECESEDRRDGLVAARSKPKDALKAALEMIAGALLFVYFGQQLGIVPQFGYGPVADAVIAAAAVFVGVTLLALFLGMGIAEYLKWRYNHRIVLLEGSDD
jgi:NhaP-type Na+/H+ or K+/H+ antiporter